MQAALRLFNIKVPCESDAGKDDYSATDAVTAAASAVLRTTTPLPASSITVLRKSYDCRTPLKLRLEQAKRSKAAGAVPLRDGHPPASLLTWRTAASTCSSHMSIFQGCSCTRQLELTLW